MLLGEYDVGKAEDCDDNGKYCLPLVQDLLVDEVVIHEKWNESDFRSGYDIALIRLKSPASFLTVSYLYSFFALF